MADIRELTALIVEFRNAREWKQFHKPKDMALSLILEAAELGEHFQWKNEEQFQESLAQNRIPLGEELADVLYWTLLLAHDLGIDLEDAFRRKMKKNEEKYPLEKARGRSDKYDCLG